MNKTDELLLKCTIDLHAMRKNWPPLECVLGEHNYIWVLNTYPNCPEEKSMVEKCIRCGKEGNFRKYGIVNYEKL